MRASDGDLRRLMALAQGGDKLAYAALLDECQAWLARYFRDRIPADHVDDLIQDTLLSLHRKRASFDASRPFLPWLAVIARNRWVDHLRGFYRRAEDEYHDIVPTPDEEPQIAARLSLDRLLDLLPEAQSRAIRLVKIDGLTSVEASHLSGQSESAIKVNVHRGLKRLATMVEKE